MRQPGPGQGPGRAGSPARLLRAGDPRRPRGRHAGPGPAAPEAITGMQAEAAARRHAGPLADEAGRTLDGERRAAAARIAEAGEAVTEASAERDPAVAAAEAARADAARAREQDQQRHDAA